MKLRAFGRSRCPSLVSRARLSPLRTLPNRWRPSRTTACCNSPPPSAARARSSARRRVEPTRNPSSIATEEPARKPSSIASEPGKVPTPENKPSSETKTEAAAEPEPPKPDVWTDAEVIAALKECVRLLGPIAADIDVAQPVKQEQCGTPAPIMLKRHRLRRQQGRDQPARHGELSMVVGLHSWVEKTLQPAAMETFGSPITRLRSASGYSCRNRIGSLHGADKLSEHAKANAIDIGGFITADGRTIEVAPFLGADRARHSRSGAYRGRCAPKKMRKTAKRSSRSPPRPSPPRPSRPSQGRPAAAAPSPPNRTGSSRTRTSAKAACAPASCSRRHAPRPTPRRCRYRPLAAAAMQPRPAWRPTSCAACTGAPAERSAPCSARKPTRRTATISISTWQPASATRSASRPKAKGAAGRLATPFVLLPQSLPSTPRLRRR